MSRHRNSITPSNPTMKAIRPGASLTNWAGCSSIVPKVRLMGYTNKRIHPKLPCSPAHAWVLQLKCVSASPRGCESCRNSSTTKTVVASRVKPWPSAAEKCSAASELRNSHPAPARIRAQGSTQRTSNQQPFEGEREAVTVRVADPFRNGHGAAAQLAAHP